MARMRTSASLLVIALAACGGTGAQGSMTTPTTTPPQPTTTTTAPTTTTSEPASAAVERDALARIEAYVSAVNAGDLDAIEDAIGVPFTTGDRRGWEFHALLNANGSEWQLGDCVIIDSADWFANVECEMVYTNPVFVAAGASELIAPYALVNGELRAPQWRSVTTDFTFALNAMVRYLQMLDQYEPCDPAAQTEEFSEHGGIARVPECAEVWVEHQDDVVAWIVAGEPDF